MSMSIEELDTTVRAFYESRGDVVRTPFGSLLRDHCRLLQLTVLF